MLYMSAMRGPEERHDHRSLASAVRLLSHRVAKGHLPAFSVSYSPQRLGRATGEFRYCLGFSANEPKNLPENIRLPEGSTSPSMIAQERIDSGTLGREFADATDAQATACCRTIRYRAESTSSMVPMPLTLAAQEKLDE